MPGAGHGGETTQHSLLEEAGFEVKEWRDILGERFFGLPLADSRPRFAPTFRSLFPYFARRQASGGLGHPERHTRDQQLSDQQVAVSYLLGLDWDVPRQLQEVREKEKTIRQLRKGTRRAPSDASFHRPRSYGPTRPWPSAVSMR
jgi:uncharacterized protein YydD (DUF2326 family)